MPRSIEYSVDCEKKLVTITWKVLITGTGSGETRSDILQSMFRRRFNPTPPFKIGDCVLRVVLDVREDEDLFGRQFDDALLQGDRDVIDIAEARPDGGGFYRPGRGRAHVHINPDSRSLDGAGRARLNEWKTINELGHGLGIDDRHAGLRGEWNLDGNPPRDVIYARHLEEALNRAAPDAVKRQINECCGAQLTVARETRPPVAFPDRPLDGQNPRDAAWEIFPPGSENPFTPGYEEKMARWQRLVRRYGLTEAYRRWQEENRKKAGGSRKTKKKGKRTEGAKSRRAKRRVPAATPTGRARRVARGPLAG